MGEDSEGEELFSLLADRYSVAVLTAASHGPITVGDVVERYDVSEATVYRRITDLGEYGLLREGTRFDDAGNQFSVYEAAFDAIEIEITNGVTYVHVMKQDDHEVYRVYEYEE